MAQLDPRRSRGPNARAVLIAGAALIVVLLAGRAGRHFTWNLSPSLPRGLYRLRSREVPSCGAIVSFAAPRSAAATIAERRYLPPAADLLKIIVAVPGDRVDIDGTSYRVNGRTIGAVLPADAAGRPLTSFHFSGLVPAGLAFVATSAQRSFDSRYFGPVPLSTMTLAVPVWTY